MTRHDYEKIDTSGIYKELNVQGHNIKYTKASDGSLFICVDDACDSIEPDASKIIEYLVSQGIERSEAEKVAQRILEESREVERKPEGLESYGISLGEIVVHTRPYEVIWEPYHGLKLHIKTEDRDEVVPVFYGRINARVIRDKYLGLKYYVLCIDDECQYDVELKSLIKWAIEERASIRYGNKSVAEVVLKALIRYAEERAEESYVYEGFYPDGYHDGVVKYPVRSWECRPDCLEELINIIEQYYGLNKTQALFNVAMTLAKVFTPALRMHRSIFEDKIIINSGPRRAGKTTLQYLIIQLLNFVNNERTFIRVVGDNPIATVPRLRNLLSLHMAPLFLDEILENGMKTIGEMILGIATETSIIGLHASHYGLGFSTVMIALRPIIVNTNLPDGEIRAILGGKRNIDAYLRRIHIVNWHRHRLKIDEMPELKGSIIGCLRELWEDNSIRFILLRSRDIYELAIQLLVHFGMAYNVKVSPLIKAVEELKEEWLQSEEAYEVTEEERVIERAYEIARRVLGRTNISIFDVINAILDNPHVFDVKLVKPRFSDKVVEEQEKLAKLKEELPPDYKPLIERFEALASQGYYAIAIFAKSRTGLMPSVPRQLFGHEPMPIMDSGRKRHAYVIPFSEFLTAWLSLKTEIEEEGQGESHEGNQ